MPDEEKIEEETYSLIFASLKHPIRRKILRMLSSEARTFSEILEAVSIDSGHLNYHLQNLGDLITHSPDGKYGLSSIGVAAVKLMSGVEEHPPVAIPLKSRHRAVFNILTKIAVTVLIVTLIASSLFFIGFTKSDVRLDSETKGWFVTIPPNQTVKFNFTIVFTRKVIWAWKGGYLSVYMDKLPLVNKLTEWEKGWLRFKFEFNTSFYFYTNITIHYPSGVTEEPKYNLFGPIIYDRPPIPPETPIFPVTVPITQSGTYLTEFENVGPEPITCWIGYELLWEHFERPYFYWSIVGLLIAFTYPTLTLIKQLYLRIEGGRSDESMNLKGLVIKFRPLIMAFILTLNSLSFSKMDLMVDYVGIYYGFPLFWLTRVLVTFAGRVDYFCFGSIPFLYPEFFGSIAFLVDLIFWLVIAHFALRFLRAKKLPLIRNKLILGILGIIIFALELFWIAFPEPWKIHTGAFFWEALVGGTLMLAGFFYILSVGRLGEAKEKKFI